MSWFLTLVSSAVLFDLALKSAAVMLLACVVTAVLGRASAAWRHLVWCLAVTSLLLLPALSLALPAWRVTWLPQWAAEPARPTPSEWTTLVQELNQPRDMETIVAPAEADVPATPPIPLPSTFIVEAARPTTAPFPWPTVGWAAGALLSLIPLAIGLWQLAALQRRSRVIGDQRWLTLLDELRRQLAVHRSVQLRKSAKALVPLTWGALKPLLLVPDQADQWPEQRRRLVLLHELAHIRRWDWLTQLVAHIACALYWFNPLVWLAARQMRIERERACDDLVLASGARASDYAEELLSLAAGLTDSRVSTLVAVPMARRGALEDRLRGILDSRRSRAALTSAVVCLGMAVAAVAIAPLAMLRAAPPKPRQPAASEPKAATPAPDDTEKKRATEKPAQRDPTPEEIEARKNGIRISVLNAKGDRGIPEFRVIAGVSSRGVADEFEKRTGRTVINWQPHTCRIGKEGDYVWPLDKAYDEMAIRVEADGYAPQVFFPIKKANGVQHIVFLLTEDQGVKGRVLTPDGKPAAGATVALSIPQQQIYWEEGKLRGADQPLPESLRDRWQRPRFVKADAEGRFQLPTEYEPAAVLIVHESGVLEMPYDAWKESSEVKLKKWGSIAGQILWQDKPGVDEEVTLSVHRDEYGYPGMVASYGKTRTDKEGKFTFDRVLPGLVQISRPSKPSGPNAAGITGVILNGMFQHVKVAAGDATPVLLGGQGRKVTGKFVGLDSWDGATFHFHPTAPHIGFGGDDVSWKAFGELQASAIGPLLFRDKQPINKDGTFTIENMLPGSYQLFLSVPGFARHSAYTQVQIEPETPGVKPAAVELKEIAVNKPVGVKAAAGAADKAAEKAAEKPAAKTVHIRGKVLDDATGKPIEISLIVQAGKFDPADPKNVQWGFSEGRSSARDGSFSTTIRWADGWTARILADGYIPQPVITSAPPDDKDEIEVVIRLRPGPKVKGVVLDHTGKPVKDAAVFAIGPTGLNLAGGQAVGSEAQGARTDSQGKFELPIGDARALAVTHATFDAWPAEIPAKGDVTIRLPQPAKVEVDLAVDGADKESVIFYQLLTEGRKEFAGLRLERETRMANPGKLTLASLPPGRYQLCRSVMNHLGEIGFGAFLDRQFFELKAGESKSIDFAREKGARVRGKVTWPAETKLMGIVVALKSEKAEKSPLEGHEWTTVYASHTADADGKFLTERVAPGKYVLAASAYVPLTPEQRFRTGVILPSFRAQITIEVPAEGELTVPDLALKPGQGEE